MGGTKWTDEQKKAIETRDCSLLVAAAAGAGKTAVLVERIIQRILDDKKPVDIDRLLVVTFTNAAASEMRERIGDAISKELEKNPDSLRLQRQISLLGKAEITTTHSFCLEVIRSNFHLIDLDPTFRIADGTESVLLKQEALEEVFEDRYEDGKCTPEFLDLVECYGGGRDDRKLHDMVLKLYEFSESTPWPEKWLIDMAEKFNTGNDFGSSLWAKVLMDNMRIELTGVLETMERALNILEGIPDLEPYYTHTWGEIHLIRRIFECCTASWDELIKSLKAMEFETLPRCKKGCDKETQEKVKKLRDNAKKQIAKIKKDILAADSRSIKDELKKLHPSMKCLAELGIEFGVRYREKKKEKGLIDFNDIEHYCIDILTETREDGSIEPSPTAIKYRERFEEILVDEYQDSNMVQELILSMISRKEPDNQNLFMVGDVKQSIYRFRQAKPELFLEKYNRYGDSGRERRILLYKNFRSRGEVLDAANYLFKGIMSKNLGELEYDDNEKLNTGADYAALDDGSKILGGPVEVHIINSAKIEEDTIVESDEDPENEGLVEEEDLDSVQLEARMAAKRIIELVGGGSFVVYDKNLNDYRLVEYRDIVILMRSVASSAPVYQEELFKKGIPVYADTGSGYFEAIEVQTMMSLLQVIDNPMQDIPLLAVLRSPIASFTPEELMDIRMADSRMSFYEALKMKADSKDDSMSKKALEFLKGLEIWRKKSLTMSISQFIWYLYTNTGYYAYAGAMPGGVQRQANLRILFERARQYEETSFKGLFNFINFINKIKKSSGDMGSAKTLGENENVVRIMSIHKSKGLEFPVVIVSGLGKKFNLRDLESKILFHHELGFGPDFVDSRMRFSYPTIVKQALKKKMKLESYSEEMRILYVAFTRAKEKLIITGTVGNMEKAFARWSEGVNTCGNKVPEYQILKGNNFLDWICPVLLKHRDSSKFRESAGIKEVLPSGIIEDGSKWEITFVDRKDILMDDTELGEAAVGSADARHEETGKYVEEIRRRLDYEYPYRMSSKLPAKLSVTELKRMYGSVLDDEYTQHIFVPSLVKKPSFLEGKVQLTAAEKGTMTHLVMQHVDLDKSPTIEYVKSLVEYMVSGDFITREQASCVNTGRIVRFFESPLGERMLKAKSVKREVPFYIEIKGTEVYKDLPEDLYGGEGIILQGIIDCWFEEEDGIVLIDYKTDYVPEGKSHIIKEKYGVQIEYYTKALEKMTGKPVKEKYIYLFYNGEILKI